MKIQRYEPNEAQYNPRDNGEFVLYADFEEIIKNITCYIMDYNCGCMKYGELPDHVFEIKENKNGLKHSS